jgi:hypothetical protein
MRSASMFLTRFKSKFTPPSESSSSSCIGNVRVESATATHSNQACNRRQGPRNRRHAAMQRRPRLAGNERRMSAETTACECPHWTRVGRLTASQAAIAARDCSHRMWPGPGADVARSWRRCGQVMTQMWPGHDADAARSWHLVSDQ